MTIRVERHHIEQGRADHTLRNPIALAAQVQDRFAVVTSRFLHVQGGVCPLPTFAADWLGRFNRGESVHPIVVQL